MKQKTATRKKSYSTALYGVLAIGVVLALAFVIVGYKMNSLEKQLTKEVEVQTATLKTLAIATGAGDADTETKIIVKDCVAKDRSEFDDLLSKLDSGLTTTELATLDGLFGRCGTMVPLQMVVMSDRFIRETASYESNLLLLSTVTGSNAAKEFQIETWKELANASRAQAELYFALANQQRQIIDYLLEGKSASGTEIKSVLEETRKTKDSILAKKAEIANLTSIVVPK
jgi:hypothetical protein